jgi:type VI secretion system protein ImpA
MSTERLLSDDLLDPIAPDHLAGEDLRWSPEWDRVEKARQSDDDLSVGKWRKKESKTADWRLVETLATVLLQTRSKDLQIAIWLTEASLKLHGPAGLRDGLRLIRELMDRFWDAGLYPAIEDGPADRSGPLDWLNEKLVDSVLAIPITHCSTQDRDYSLIDLRDARLVGSEAQCKTEDGDIDPPKQRDYDKALAAGRISLDMFESAVRDTKRTDYEALSSDFEEAYQEFSQLERLVEEKFGEAAPNLGTFRGALKDIQQAISDLLQKKRQQEPNASPIIQKDSLGQPATRPESVALHLPLPSLSSQATQNGNGTSWQDAERLVRSGQVDAGLAEMTRLAASETTGRSCFERKLLLAEVCLNTNRVRLARAVLEELAEQIESHHLETWESSELIGGVWTRLCKVYKGDSSDSEEAAKLYGKLCRLDPWQALNCTE